MIPIILNDRCTKIFSKIINETEPIKLSRLCEDFNVSYRTIRYDIQKINDFLECNNLPKLVVKPNVGVIYNNSPDIQKRAVDTIEKISIYNYSLTQNERVELILTELLQQKDYITINYLADKLMMSRSTIVKDTKHVRRWLLKYNLKLNSMPKHGMKIEGEEKFYRKAAIELLTHSVDSNKVLNKVNPHSSKMTYIEMNSEIKKMFDDMNIEFIEECILIAEKQLETIFSDEAFYGLVFHIAIALKRIKLGRDIIMPYEELKTFEITKEFTAASFIAGMLEKKFNVEIPYDEIGYITVHLLGSNVTYANPADKQDWARLQLLTGQILKNVSAQLECTDLLNDKQLFKGLIEHLYPAIYRLKHDLKLKNPLIEEIKKNYKELFHIVINSIKPVEDYIGKTFNDEEIGYFTLHFGAALERHRKANECQKNILIVCSTGLGTARLLSTKIGFMFNVNIVDIIAYHQVKEVLQNNSVDLIVTTLDIKVEGVECIKVNPFITEQDAQKLSSYLEKIDNYDKKVTELNNKQLDSVIKIIEKNCIIKNYENLVNDLSSVLSSSDGNEQRGVVQPLLKEVISENTIKLNVEVKDWKEAVKIGGEMLEKEDIIEHRYIDAMIETVEEMGPYIVIAEGIAMPHARPEKGAKKIGFGFLTLKNPVEFGNKEYDPVKIVIFLCAVDNTTHLKALSELMDLIENDKFILLLNSTSDKNEVLDFINSSSN